MYSQAEPAGAWKPEYKNMYPYISFSDINNQQELDCIYHNLNENYYISDNWSPEMYDALAYSGFICVSAKDLFNNDYLIPEIQTSYAVLHWTNLHVSRRLRQHIKKMLLPDNAFFISINNDMNAVFEGIKQYHQKSNWLCNRYITLLKTMHRQANYKQKIISVELWHQHHLIGGEIGYLTGSIYTSLTGFLDKNNYSHFGKIQMIALADLLKNSGVSFWNMGHPYMQYKFDLGAREYSRLDFLNLWLKYRNKKIQGFLDTKKIKLLYYDLI
jgi:Leu/Phe-tRNA-protein transferase